MTLGDQPIAANAPGALIGRYVAVISFAGSGALTKLKENNLVVIDIGLVFEK